MSTTMRMVLTLTLALGGGAARAHGTEGHAKSGGEKVTMDQLPGPVADTLRDQAHGGKIEELEKEPNGKGGYTYEAEIVKGGQGRELKLDERGKILSSSTHSEKGEHEEGEK